MTQQTPLVRALGIATIALFLILLIGWTQQSFAADVGTLPLSEDVLSAEKSQAQTVALASRELRRGGVSGRSEVFQVAALPQFRPHQQELCADITCYQVDIYDYATGASTTVIVDVTNSRVLDIFQLANSHPMYSEAVAERAKALMMNNAELIAGLGRPIDAAEIMLMDGQHAQVAGCDGSNLCLTNVFVVDSGNIWVTVNMQDNAVADVWWTARAFDGAEAGKATAHNNVDNRGSYCNDTYTHSAGGWDVDYELSNTDGLHAYNISYQGADVADSIKLVEWHVDYKVQNPIALPAGFVDYTSCGMGAGSGFPIVAYAAPEILPIVELSQTVGFEIVQDYRMSNWGNTCRYRYEQHYQFYNDGRWRVVGGAFGRGCGNAQLEEAVYRPVMRIDLTPSETGEYFDYWNPDTTIWTSSATEKWFGQGQDGNVDKGFPTNSEGHAFRIHDGSRGYYIEPGVGQFGDAGTGDDAWLYLTRFQASEGAADITTLGACCNQTHQQGPHNFINGETVAGENTVIWYVPEQYTITSYGAALPPEQRPGDVAYCWNDTTGGMDDTYPCFAGPMFVPLTIAPTAVSLQEEISAETIPTAILLIFTVGTLGALSIWQIRRIRNVSYEDATLKKHKFNE